MVETPQYSINKLNDEQLVLWLDFWNLEDRHQGQLFFCLGLTSDDESKELTRIIFECVAERFGWVETTLFLNIETAMIKS